MVDDSFLNTAFIRKGVKFNMASQIKFNNKPSLGEKLWIDDPKKFKERIDSTHDEYLRESAIFFKENGYLIVKGAVTEERCNNAILDFKKWAEENDNAEYNAKRGKKRRIVNLHSDSSAHKQLITKSDKLLSVLDFLFGYKMSVYTSISFEYGTEQPLHIDTPVFSTSPREFYFGVWVALESASVQNGCLRALAGAHAHRYIDEFEFARNRVDDVTKVDRNALGLWNDYQKELVENAINDGNEEVYLEVDAGDVIIWHPQLPHGGSPIINERLTRYSTVFHVVPEGTPVYQADVYFNPDLKNISNEASYIYEKEDDILFRVGVGAHFGGH